MKHFLVKVQYIHLPAVLKTTTDWRVSNVNSM